MRKKETLRDSIRKAIAIGPLETLEERITEEVRMFVVAKFAHFFVEQTEFSKEQIVNFVRDIIE